MCTSSLSHVADLRERVTYVWVGFKLAVIAIEISSGA